MRRERLRSGIAARRARWSAQLWMLGPMIATGQEQAQLGAQWRDSAKARVALELVLAQRVPGARCIEQELGQANGTDGTGLHEDRVASAPFLVGEHHFSLVRKGEQRQARRVGLVQPGVLFVRAGYVAERHRALNETEWRVVLRPTRTVHDAPNLAPLAAHRENTRFRIAKHARQEVQAERASRTFVDEQGQVIDAMPAVVVAGDLAKEHARASEHRWRRGEARASK